MSYSLLQIEDFPLTSFKNYRKAIVGLYHIAFVKDNYEVIFSFDDKESIKNAFNYHQMMLQKGIKTYPVSSNKGFKDVPITKKEALLEILGLPKMVTDKLDFNKDIVSQLKFEDNIFELKKYAYKNMYEKFNKHWYQDDFKAYCLNNGVFFLYDETNPFIDDTSPYHLPVFIDENKASKEVLDYTRSLTSEYIFTQYSNKNHFTIGELKKYDQFSFSDKVDYFINNIYIEKISNLGPTAEFKSEYSLLLKVYFSYIITYLYDNYLKEKLFIETDRKSLMAPIKEDIYYVVSNLNSEMYSLDGKEFFFPSTNKKFLISLYDEYKSIKDPLKIYKNLKLPFNGYKEFKECLKKSKTNPFKKIKYIDISVLDDFKSIKYGKSGYGYTINNDEHNSYACLRELKKYGVFYSQCNNLVSLDEELTIEFKNENIHDALKPIFNENVKFSGDVFESFTSACSFSYDTTPLYQFLVNLDKISDNKALYYFYHHINGSLENSINNLFKFYNVDIDLQTNYLFFSFLLQLPFIALNNYFKNLALLSNNTFLNDRISLNDRPYESYEIGLPYKYVSYSRIAYTFREKYDSQAYFCSCQKKAILNLLHHYYKKTKVENPTLNRVETNKKFISDYHLPLTIVSNLDLTKSLSKQFQFKNHLCHLCNHKEPHIFEENNITNNYKTNTIYETYINAIGCKSNIFTSTVIKQDEIFKKLDDAMNNSVIPPVVYFDKNSCIQPILTPYFNLDGLELASLIISFFQNDIGQDEFDNCVLEISSLSKNEVADVFFNYLNVDDENAIMRTNSIIYPQLQFLYKILTLAYKIELSKHEIPFLDESICLNIDYSPKLTHPYVFLGKVFNAYSDDDSGESFYFCQCDKEAIFNSVTFVSKIFDTYYNINKQLYTSTILTLAGLPYVVCKKYAHYSNFKDVLNDLKFKSGICRRCLNENHAAYFFPFLKALPYKDEMEADYSFVKNYLIKDGIYFLDEVNLASIKFDPDHKFNLNSHFDPLYPNIIIFDNMKDKANGLYNFMVTSIDIMENYIFEYISRSNDDKVNLALFSNIILESYKVDNKFIYKILSNAFILERRSFKAILNKEIPMLKNSTDVNDTTYQEILGFFTYLFEEFFKECALNEKRIGRK